jgi:hypothetical protein
MRRPFSIAVFAALLAVAANLVIASPARAAEPVFPAASRIGLVPPNGLAVSTRFLGFEDAARQVIVSFLDLPPAAYDELERLAFSDDQRGLREVKRESFPFEGGVGFLISGVIEANGTKVHRWSLVANIASGGVAGLVMLVRAEVPEAARTVYSDEVVRAMLASVSLREVPVNELLGLLPFKLTDFAGFRLVRVMPEGLVVIDGPSNDMSKHAYAIVTVGSGAPENPDDRARFANDILMTVPLRGLQVATLEAMRIRGGPGIEVRATAAGANGESVKLVQWLQFARGGGNFLRVVGVAGNDQWDEVFNRFRKLRDSVEPRS